LTAIASGFATVALRGLAPGSEGTELRLAPGGTLAGALDVDPPPRSFTVHLSSRDEARGIVGRVRTETFDGTRRGGFRIEDLADGRYGVDIEAPGFDVLDRPEAVVRAGQITEGLLIRLRRRD